MNPVGKWSPKGKEGVDRLSLGERNGGESNNKSEIINTKIWGRGTEAEVLKVGVLGGLGA